MKTCQQCGTTFGKRPSEAHHQFKKKLFCSRPCADLGRRRPGRSAAPACSRGHEFTEENTYVRAGKRNCRSCRRERERGRPRDRDRTAEYQRRAAKRAVKVFPGPQPTEVWRPVSWRQAAS